MGIVSYAQNFEDVLLNRVFGSTHYAFYVDIGAYHPVNDSVTKSFYDRGWEGINIEPGEIFDQLAAARPRDINLHMAVYDHAGTVDFVQHPGWYAGLSHVKGNTETGEAGGRTGAEFRSVPCDTLTNILARYGSQRPIAFLKIDAEGSEEAIIRTTDWRAIRPTVILVEATKPRSTVLDNQRWEPVLLEHGYQRAYFDGINCYYVPDERADLLRHFEIPVNILDGFQRYDPRLAEARAHADASETRVKALESELALSRVQHDRGEAQATQLADQNAALQRELQDTRDRLEAARLHIDTLPAVQSAAVAAVVEANGYQVADLRSQLADATSQLVAVRHQLASGTAELTDLRSRFAALETRCGDAETRCAAATWERDALRSMQDQAARLRHLLRELQWPDGPAALRAVLPLARLLRRLAGTKAPPIPPEELALLSSAGPPVIAGPVAPPFTPARQRSMSRRAVHLAYKPFRPIGRPPFLRLRAFLTTQIHTEFDQLDTKLERLREDLTRIPTSPPVVAGPAPAPDPRIAELQTEMRQFGRLLEDTLLTLALSGAETRSDD